MSGVKSVVAVHDPIQNDPPQAGAHHLPLRRLDLAWLAAVLVLLALVYYPTVAWLVDRWTMSVWHNAHGMLIPIVVAYFAYL